VGPKRQIVGLELSWDAVEALYGALRLPTQVATTASRVHVPVYKGGRQVGRATSTTWSPTLKQLIALATIDRPHTTAGTEVDVEITVEAVRHRVPARVVATPFYNPDRKTKTPPD
jgi:aminomethyltransferase